MLPISASEEEQQLPVVDEPVTEETSTDETGEE